MIKRLHICDDGCACPIHDTPLIYWPHGDEHACQDVTCEHGHGMVPFGPFPPIRPVPGEEDDEPCVYGDLWVTGPSLVELDAGEQETRP